jgi:CRISPR/Cas system CSM-associated protein Csm3 (group 7 of RAMP superfamily)
MIDFVKIATELEAKDAFRIGTGGGRAEPGGVDNEVFRLVNSDGRYDIIVPGSSLKGVFRSSLYALQKKISNEICGIGSQTSCDSANCFVCDTYGNTKKASKISFENLSGIAKTGIKYEVRIDYRTGMAGGGGPRQMEYVAKQSKFKGFITGRDVELANIGAILLAINEIHLGLRRLGGGKSRGFGQVDIKVTGIEALSTVDLDPTLQPFFNSEQSASLVQLKSHKIKMEQYEKFQKLCIDKVIEKLNSIK